MKHTYAKNYYLSEFKCNQAFCFLCQPRDDFIQFRDFRVNPYADSSPDFISSLDLCLPLELHTPTC